MVTPASSPQPAAPAKPRIASAGKRLWAFLMDVLAVILLLNTVRHGFRPENWDLLPVFELNWRDYVLSSLGIFALLLLKDSWGGKSPGKMIWGIHVRRLDDLESPPSFVVCFLRNLSLLGFPAEGFLLLRDKHLRRWGDRWQQTVVLENPRAIRPLMRLMGANILFFGFFASMIWIERYNSEKTAAYQTAISFLGTHTELQERIGAWEAWKSPELQMAPQTGTALLKIQAVGQKDQLSVFVQLHLQREPLLRWQVDSVHLGETPPSVERSPSPKP